MAFDPSQPFQVVRAKSGFDASQPFEVVGEPDHKKPDFNLRGEFGNVANVQAGGSSEIRRVDPIPESFIKAKIGDRVKIPIQGDLYEVTKTGEETAGDLKNLNPNAGSSFSIENVLAKAGLSAPASGTFLTTMGATSRALQPLQAGGPIGKTVATVGPLVMGAAAAALEGILQRKVTEEIAPQINRYEESLTPAENLIGGALGSGFRPGGFSGTLREQALERLVPAAAGAGIQGGIEIAQGGQEGAGGRILESALTNALLNKTTGPGQKLIGLGTMAAEKIRPSLVAKADAVAGKSPKGLINTKANEIAMGSVEDNPENLAGLGPGLRTTQRGPLAETLTPKPEVTPIDNFKAFNEERGQRIVDAITKHADEQSFRENVRPLGLDAAEAAEVFEQGRIAKESADQVVNYAGASVTPETLTLGELIGSDVEYAGYKGKLIREKDGTLSVLQPVATEGKPNIVEIAGSGKSMNTKALDVGVKGKIPSRPKAQADFLGFQEDGQGGGFDLWNLKKPVENKLEDIVHPKDSTVSSDTLMDAGFSVPDNAPKSPKPSGGMVQGNAAPLIGAVIGYQFGDTPEEKRRNALIGAGIGLGGVLGQSMVKTLVTKNKGILDQINRLAVEARAKGQTTWDNYITGMKTEAPASDSASLEVNLKTPPAELSEVQDAPSGDTASPSPRYQWTPFLSKTSVGKALKKVIGTIEGNIFPISPRVGGAVREYSGLIDQLKVEWTAGTYELGRTARKIMTPEEVKAFDYELQFGSHATARQMLVERGGEEVAALLDKAKATYDKMASSEESVGRTINRIEDAWPRQMLDYAKFRAAMKRPELGALDAALAAAKKAKGRKLTEIEEADILNDAVSLSLRGKPSFLKSRTIQELTQGQFLDHYEPFDVAMDNRIAKVSRDVAKRKFLGKESPENTDDWDGETGDFGTILQEEITGERISPEGQKVIKENLKDFLRQDGAAGNAIAEFGNKISRAQNILFLGDISTSVAQFGDLFVNIRRYGLSSALKGVVDQPVKLKDLGLGGDTFAETQNLSRAESNQGIGGKARRTRDAIIQTMVGWADKVNKQSTVNAARIEYTKVLRDPTSREYVRLHEKYAQRFPERWPEILKDLKSVDFEKGKLTDNTRFFLFNELADIQPVSMAQRAQLENASAGTRFLYSLKRYWIKQLDILRQEGYEKIKNNGTRGEGVKNIATYLAIVSAMQGVAIATIRDVMFGREVDLEENSLQGVFQTFGVSKYMLDNIREGSAGKAAANFISPMVSVVDDATRDYASFFNNPIEDFPGNSRLLKYLPIVGREAYYWAGAGEEAKAKAELKQQKSEARGEATPSLGALGKLFAPPETKKK